MNSCWTIGDSPGCGEGVFATRTIKAGEEVGFAKSIPAKNEIWQRDKYIIGKMPFSSFCSIVLRNVVAGVDRETLADIPKREARHC